MRSLHVARAALCVALQVPLLAVISGDASAVPLLTGFGGPTGYGLPQNCVHPNDDGSYAPDEAAALRDAIQGCDGVR